MSNGPSGKWTGARSPLCLQWAFQTAVCNTSGTYTLSHSHTQTCYAQARTQTRTHINIRTRTRRRTYTRTRTRTNTRTHARTHAHTHTHTHTRTHAHTHTHTHAHRAPSLRSQRCTSSMQLPSGITHRPHPYYFRNNRVNQIILSIRA